MKIIIPIFLALFITLILETHANTGQKDQNLIVSTCKRTPNYRLCVATLRGSSAGDVRGLAMVMVAAVKKKTKVALSAVNSLKRSRHDRRMTAALQECTDVYNAVLEGDVAEAEQGLQFGDPKFAENGMADAVIEADSCEGAFGGAAARSPLTAVNKAVRDLAEVARAVIRNLL